LAAGDFAALAARAMEFVGPGRVLAMLEGGYDLRALAASVSSLVGVLAGAGAEVGNAARDEQYGGQTNGGPGTEAVEAVRLQWDRHRTG
jgi:acetoin utilization deacetylase AcuC-like enzyme